MRTALAVILVACAVEGTVNATDVSVRIVNGSERKRTIKTQIEQQPAKLRTYFAHVNIRTAEGLTAQGEILALFQKLTGLLLVDVCLWPR